MREIVFICDRSEKFVCLCDHILRKDKHFLLNRSAASPAGTYARNVQIKPTHKVTYNYSV